VDEKVKLFMDIGGQYRSVYTTYPELSSAMKRESQRVEAREIMCASVRGEIFWYVRAAQICLAAVEGKGFEASASLVQSERYFQSLRQIMQRVYAAVKDPVIPEEIKTSATHAVLQEQRVALLEITALLKRRGLLAEAFTYESLLQ
jgi:hypothetical protein